MWREELGNDMKLAVNQSNGNAVLEYPLDVIGTEAAPLEINLKGA